MDHSLITSGEIFSDSILVEDVHYAVSSLAEDNRLFCDFILAEDMDYNVITSRNWKYSVKLLSDSF